jgi:hypothetical protein
MLRDISRVIGKSICELKEGFGEGLKNTNTPKESESKHHDKRLKMLCSEVKEYRESLRELINSDPDEARRQESLKLVAEIDELRENQEYYKEKLEVLIKKLETLQLSNSFTVARLEAELKQVRDSSNRKDKKIHILTISTILFGLLSASSIAYQIYSTPNHKHHVTAQPNE